MKTQVNAIIMKLAFLDRQPLDDSRLKEDLGFDSLKIVELIIEIEDELKIQFEESDLNPSQIITLEDLHDLVAKTCSAKVI